jgi:hypothetical protein
MAIAITAITTTSDTHIHGKMRIARNFGNSIGYVQTAQGRKNTDKEDD